MSGRSSPNLLGGLQTVNTMSGFSSPQGATLSQTSMQSVSSAASQNNHITLNPINPLGFASHKDLKRLSEDLERAISNGHNVEPKAFISDDLRVLINTNVRIAKLDKDPLGQICDIWTQPNDIFFKIVLKAHPEVAANHSPLDTITIGLNNASIRNLRKIPLDARTTYFAKINKAVNSIDPTVLLSNKNYKTLLDILIGNLSKHCNDTSLGAAHMIQRRLRHVKIENFEDYQVHFGEISNEVNAALAIADEVDQKHFSQDNHQVPKNKKRSYDKPPNTNEDHPQKQNKLESSQENSRACTGCGKGGHTYDNCLFVKDGHPDVNNNRNISWDDSAKGQAWKRKGKQTLPAKLTLEGGIRIPPQGLPAPKESSQYKCTNELVCICNNYISPLQTNLKHSVYVPITLSNSQLQQQPQTLLSYKASALLDSGAISANYTHKEVALKIAFLGIASIENDSNITCGAFINSCKKNFGTIKLTVNINDERTNNTYSFKTVFKILENINYEIIIGRPDIRLHDLTNTCRSQFYLPREGILQVNQGAQTTSIKKLKKRKFIESKSLRNKSVKLVEKRTDQLFAHIQHFSNPYCLGETLEDIDCCCVLEDEPSGYLIKHIHELIDKDDELDELTKEKIANNQNNNNSWDAFLNPIEKNNDSVIPTQVGLNPKRHNEIFDKYKKTFSRTVNKQPASLPPMVLKVDEKQWKHARNRLPPRVQSVERQTAVLETVKELNELTVIRPSQAEEWSQIHMVKKPNGKWRTTQDLKHLNACTEGLGYPIPNINDIKTRISAQKPKFYASLDLTSGYHQIPLAEESKKYTAFRTSLGLHEWCRMTMGLKGAGHWFQYVLATIVLAGILWYLCELYIDDVLVFGKDEEEYFTNLEKVLQRFALHNITVNPDKCVFGKTEIDYLGHRFSAEGISHTQKRIDKVLEMEKPTTSSKLKSFIGVAEYFHDHIKDIAETLRPLRAMITPYIKGKTLIWTNEAIKAFEKIKEDINNCPSLYFMHSDAPVYLHTDASDYGIGAYLFQVIDGKEHPVMFMSKTLSAHEIKWSTIDKEAYAIMYALHKMDHLLRDIPFILKTDHKNLIYLKDSKSPRVNRWKLEAQNYNFRVEHIPGIENVIADAFSRLIDLNTDQLNSLQELDLINLMLPLRTIEECEQLNNMEDYFIKIPPEAYSTIGKCHNSRTGHHGVERTLEKIESLIKNSKGSVQKWINMRAHVRTFIKKCPLCQKMSVLKLPIQTIKFTAASYHPMQRINIDTINMDHEDEYGNKHIIVIIDCFSRWVGLYGAPDLTAISAAQVLLQHVGTFGVPDEIQSDRGTQYLNELIDELNKLFGSSQILNIAPHSKEESAIVERSNKEVLRHLRGLIFEKNFISNWSQNLPIVQRIINASTHESLGCSPSQILFGNSINLDKHIFLPPQERPTNLSLPKWLADKLSAQDAIVKQAQHIQFAKDMKHMATIKPQLTSYNIDEYVLIESPPTNLKSGPENKLLTNLRGPMKVIKKLNLSSYELEDLISHKIETVHIKRIHPFYYDKELVNPYDIAYRDQQQWKIHSVLSHRGNKIQPKSMEFEVKWEPIGDNESKITWELYKTLRATDALHTYLNNNKMKSLIPSIFKVQLANRPAVVQRNA